MKDFMVHVHYCFDVFKINANNEKEAQHIAIKQVELSGDKAEIDFAECPCDETAFIKLRGR